ncbi:DUF262 domain-containing protein [Arthrobacter agilis]|uniref:DUF262 domain-containing protein n=1 Tax=Arthrobacter agilis TaxID=37921 RepID=UPI0023659A57|nr:DUF262 domain-containing protein [Arthrobacter agilis]WDF34019.1 DUF262 domain-containing protein [Arthrobacter agilis]
MQAGDVSLGKVFANDHQNYIPLFQRPYVWDEVDNWEPLWDDVRKASVEVEQENDDTFGASTPRTYFLGAIVSQARRQMPRRLSASNVIDGQQRLTTLQTLLSAARWVAHAKGYTTVTGKFTSLLENRQETIHEAHPEDVYKVWPLPQDNHAFRWVLRPLGSTDGPPRADHKIVRAFLWFQDHIGSWVSEARDPEIRLETLFSTLRDRMQLVHIVLDRQDDPQVIFEALNHRGVALDAADLVKNLLFQTVEEQGDHKRADDLLMDGWLPLDDTPWRDEITTGRIKRSRVDILLSYWLTIRSGQEVLVDHLFADFKIWLSSGEASAAEVIGDIRQHADTFLAVQHLAEEHPLSILLDRMSAPSTTTPWPTLLFLYAHPSIPDAQRELAVHAIDSFLMRRGMCGLTSADYNRLFLQVLIAAKNSDPHRAGEAVVHCLSNQTAPSRVWPSNDMFERAITGDPIYKSVYRARLKSFLVGIENHIQSGKSEPRLRLSSAEKRLNIEHILPQSWEKNWPVHAEADETAKLRRASRLHRLGNLTLLTSKLNPALSNKAWASKRKELAKHSLLRLNALTVLSAPDTAQQYRDEQWAAAWDEERIDLRTEQLAILALKIWAGPQAASEPAEESESVLEPSVMQALATEPGLLQMMAEQVDPSDENAARGSSDLPSYLMTQVVTENDLAVGQIRVPKASKGLFPEQEALVQLEVEDVDIEASWNPRLGPDRERSGVLKLGRAMDGLVYAGSILRIEALGDRLILSS